MKIVIKSSDDEARAQVEGSQYWLGKPEGLTGYSFT